MMDHNDVPEVYTVYRHYICIVRKQPSGRTYHLTAERLARLVELLGQPQVESTGVIWTAALDNAGPGEARRVQ